MNTGRLGRQARKLRTVQLLARNSTVGQTAMENQYRRRMSKHQKVGSNQVMNSRQSISKAAPSKSSVTALNQNSAVAKDIVKLPSLQTNPQESC